MKNCSLNLLAALVCCLGGEATGRESAQPDVLIGNISFDRKPIFDPSKPGERNPAFQFANRLHVLTRESAIAAQLLFKTGDKLDQRLLTESERNLRQLRFLREPKVRVVSIKDGVANIEVTTQDVWTLKPELSFGRSGGDNKSAIGVEDSNFLGMGKLLAIGVENGNERDRRFLRYVDPNLNFGRWRLEAEFSDNSDGRSERFSLSQPFFALDTRRSFKVEASQRLAEQPRYALGVEVDRYAVEEDKLELGMGFSNGLQNGLTQRWTLGARFQRLDFSALADVPVAGAIPRDRRFAYPFLRLEGIQDGFTTLQNFDLIGRTEDVNFAPQYWLELGYAPGGLGNPNAATLFDSRFSYGKQLGEHQLLLVDAGLRARWEQGQPRSSVASAGLRYDYRWTDTWITHLNLRLDRGTDLALDELLELGGDTGLRGYPRAYQTGERRSLLTLEQRHYFEHEPLHLFNVGAAAFVNIGKVSGNSGVPEPELEWLKEFGVGLRLTSNRSSRSSVLHADITFPVDRIDGKRSATFLLETRSSF